MRSQVTTKNGDDGTSRTLGGDRLPKSHPIFECSGDVDSLRARLALCRLLVLESGREDANQIGESLYWILHVCFLAGAQCNDPENKHPEYRKLDVGPEHIEQLESAQFAIEERTRLPRQFIAAASNTLAAHVDLACTDTRRLERSVVRLKEAMPGFKCEHVLALVNRLSDYLFILARHFEDGSHATVDYGRLGVE
ncbi:MAG: ATP:cob(I)alamin adenosyltransferase [Candidatus Hydrogenedentota bacterium]